jgi:hypothetical protein
MDWRSLGLAAAVALAACGSVNAPTPAVTPPEALPDAVALAACGEVSVLLDRSTNFKPALLNFLDAVRLSGCPYSRYRVDAPDGGIGSAYNDGYSRGEALGEVRSYRRVYALDWEATSFLRDARLPEGRLRVVFLAARTEPAF